MSKIPAVFLETLVGLTEEEAFDRCNSAGVACRTRTRGGKGMVGTADYRNDRVNLHLGENGLVLRASTG